MAERRQQTGFIPSTKLLVEAWVQTEEGSGLRKMLIEWAAEHSEFSLSSQDLYSDVLTVISAI